MSTLRIFMKSGNVVTLRGIKDWKIQTTGNRITRLEITRRRYAVLFYARPIMSSIDLSQIEAITERGLL